jgi:hypothetical protein
MVRPSEICSVESRRRLLRESKALSGLDYLEVGDDPRQLTVFFIGAVPENLTNENVRIDGGERVRNIRVLRVETGKADEPDEDDWMAVTVDRVGDFSMYTLRLVEAAPDALPTDQPLSGVDPRYASLDFGFRVDCPTGLDCKEDQLCPIDLPAAPSIDYLAKDYSSFRQLVLDRLAVLLPDWRERHAADLEIALLEVLAYVGDQVSYQQDAVAMEAYLETARQRISVRRHARLVDYSMHEGCNARAWVQIQASDDLAIQASDVYFFSRSSEAVATADSPVFEPLVEPGASQIELVRAHNKIDFYTWQQRDCCLPAGAVRATLADWAEPARGPDAGADANSVEDKPAAEHERRLRLGAGDFLLFEEVIGPQTGASADADPSHRHVVRLTKVTPVIDPLEDRPVVEIEWAAADALPFALCLSTTSGPPECKYLDGVSVARGNIVMVDQGRRIDPEPLDPMPPAPSPMACEGACCEEPAPAPRARFFPTLRAAPPTYAQPLDRHQPASRCLLQNPRLARPQVELDSTVTTPSGEVHQRWAPLPDLLQSGPHDPAFVVEIDNLGVAHLRFGDGVLGQAPETGAAFRATYRVGSGQAGNVGAETITGIVFRGQSVSGVDLRARNPLPALGGTDPEPIADVKVFAPVAFRYKLERAIIAADYQQLAARDPRLQDAAATLRWTGSWYEADVALDPRQTEVVTPALIEGIEKSLHGFRRIGHDLRALPAGYVSLDVELTVCVSRDYLRGHVRAALLDTFSNRRLPDGRLGFFHPDSLTFGEGVFASRLVAAAQAVPGVRSVAVTRLQRLGDGDRGELARGVLPLGPEEIARLDNDPSQPERGRLTLVLEGGR